MSLKVLFCAELPSAMDSNLKLTVEFNQAQSGRAVLLWPDKPAGCSMLQQSQIVQRTHLDPVVLSRWPSRWRGLHSGQDHENQMSPLHNLTLLQPGTTCWFIWPEENWAWFLPMFFSLFCHWWSSGSLPLSPLACLVGDTSFPAISSTWLNRYYYNWTELDDAITEFNNELPLNENWVFTIVLLHYLYTIFLFDTVKLLWHNLCC